MATVAEVRGSGSYFPMGQLDPDYDTFLPKGVMPFEEFERSFNLAGASTEQLNPVTMNLSQTMHQNTVEGLKLLLHANKKVIEEYTSFMPSVEALAPELAEKLASGGKIAFTGCGSSGRVGIDIAAKSVEFFPKLAEQIKGRTGGGDKTVFQAKEGYEDSEKKGEEAIEEMNLGPEDTLFLISASGSARFNVGAAKAAAAAKAKVYYFYNSENVPSHTQQLFDAGTVIPLKVDIGAQSIVGSTRLEAASLAEVCLGALLGSALYLVKKETDLARAYPKELLTKLQAVDALLWKQAELESIEEFIKKEVEVFSSPNSNFYQLKDTDQGYVTLLATEDCAREVATDTVELNPTFVVKAVMAEDDKDPMLGVYHPYIIGKENNAEAGRAVLGRAIHPADAKEMEMLILAHKLGGKMSSYQNRPTGPGNFVIGVTKSKNPKEVDELIEALTEVKKRGGATGIIVTSTEKISDKVKEKLEALGGISLILEEVPHDDFGVSETFLLKTVLNLISNGSMIGMNKVHGNQMIDVKGDANGKLIDRTIRLIKWIYGSSLELSNKQLYHYIAHVSAMKKAYALDKIYTPSIIKILLGMIHFQKTPKDFKKIAEFLVREKESIDFISREARLE